MPFGSIFAQTFAPTDREILLEIVKQQTKLAEKVERLSEQQAVTATKVDGLEKSMDKRFDDVGKRFDIISNFMIGIIALIGVLIAAMFSFIGFILWDRKTANVPIKTKVNTLQKEVKELKAKELKMELYIKQISQIDNRFAPFNP